jgi:hypothetical protein
MKPEDERATPTVVPLRPAVDVAPVPRVGRIVGISADGVPLVECEHSDSPAEARFFATLDPATLTSGAEVLLFFDGGDLLRPIIAGVLAPRGRPILRSVETVETTVAADLPDFACVDGKRVVIRGRDEIVFSCGEASITLRRNGKVIVRGTKVESHSLGTQWVTGAVVKIN